MRILLALDGSASSYTACSFVASVTWPAGSVVHVLGVVDTDSHLLGPLLSMQLDGAVSELSKPTLFVDRLWLKGRAATVIVDAAEELEAELVVVGSRGRGPLRTMLLGSVSAEVVDHAPCPVLVVRDAEAGNLLMAVDGSPSADAAVTYLASSGAFTGRRVEVLSVAPSADTVMPAPGPANHDLAFEAADERRAEGDRHAEAIGTRAMQQLCEHGYDARSSISEGHAAHEIIEAASQMGCGLIVLGSRGHTGLTRLVLGSVARNVLLHASASVLIVHEPIRVPIEEAVPKAHGRAVVADAH
jgi:nucleotide-binding universal stress UspA family protein